MENEVTTASVQEIPIESIVVGERRRKKLGEVQHLAKSIQRLGLVHPILVRNGNELVAGARRLEACRRLGWETIPARAVEVLSDEELRWIEIEENAQRLDLSAFEASKDRMAQIRQAEADLKAEEQEEAEAATTEDAEPPGESPQVSQAVEFSTESVGNSPRGKKSKKKKGRGRPKKAGSREDVAEVTGISPSSQREVERHLALAEKYPFFQWNGWSKYQVIEAGEKLEQLPESERGKLGAMLDQDAIPPRTSIEIIENMIETSPAARKEIYRLAESDSEYDRGVAITRAAKVPPPVDPAVGLVREAKRQLEKAVQLCVTKEFAAQVRAASEMVTELEKNFTAFIRREDG